MLTDLAPVIEQPADEDMDDVLLYPSTEQQSGEGEGKKDGGGEEGDSDSDDEDDEDEDEDAEDEAEEIARRLTAQLWADIKEAQAAAAAPPARPPEALRQVPLQIPPPVVTDTKATSKEAAAISTVKTVLLFAATDPLVHTTLATTVVPGFESSNVLEMLQNIAQAGTISKETAGPLSQVIVSLARSELLFSPLPAVNNSNFQPQKRKRDTTDNISSRPTKRTAHDERNLQEQLAAAINVIVSTLSAHSAEPNLDSSVVASIQQQLHQVFLFAVTSSTVGGQNMTILQEISGLIQVLGVLSGIQIVQPSLQSETDGRRPLSSYNADDNRPHTDIETAVYPCLVSGCNKTFSRLYSLRTHQRVHASHRPFKCSTCPASFARNHDLKRHERGHERVVFKCLGCMKVFSRRDAIKRHKSSISAKARREDELGALATNESLQGELLCVDAAIEEVELEHERDVHASKDGNRHRRQRPWNGGAVGGPGSDDALEEGELAIVALQNAQASVIGLHGLLQKQVVKALGGDSSAIQDTSGNEVVAPAPAPTVQPSEGADYAPMDTDASLASLIARITDVASAARTSIHEPTMADSQPMNVDVPSQPMEGQSSRTTPSAPASAPTLTRYGLNADQTFLLEQAIANATAAAQAQAEAEALLEEDEEDDDEDDEAEGDEDGAAVVNGDTEGETAAVAGGS